MGKLSKKQLKERSKNSTRVISYTLSAHAVTRMKERSITTSMVADAISTGSFFLAFNDGLEKEHYRKGNMVAVRSNQTITTVYWVRGTAQWWMLDNSVEEIKEKIKWELKNEKR